MRIESKRFSIPFRHKLKTQTTIPLSFPYEAWPFHKISLSIQKFWWTCLMKNVPATFACWRFTHKNNTRNISGAPSAYGWGLGLTVWYNTSRLLLHSCGAFFSVRMIWRVIGSYWNAWQLNQTSKLTFCFLFGAFHMYRFRRWFEKNLVRYNVSHPVRLLDPITFGNSYSHSTSSKFTRTLKECASKLIAWVL